jgi:hypothetical protein
MAARAVVRTRNLSWAGMALCGAALLAACATHTARLPAKTAVVTVAQLEQMVQQGQPMGVIYGQIDGSGTVYRLTNAQRSDLRAEGMPATLLGYMDATYERAIRANPDLAKSDARWIQIGDYWYGGVPAGWPREWLTGAPGGAH